MNSITFGVLSTGCMFGSALLGIWVQSRLPRHHLDKDSHEIVKLGAGMIATITALVLGLLVSSAKSTFDAVNDGVRQTSGRLLMLDRIMAQYGADMKGVRDQLKRAVIGSMEAGAAREHASATEQDAVRHTNRLEAVQFLLRQLAPGTDGQRILLAQAHQVANDMSQTRWILMEEAQNELPHPLLAVLVAWLSGLFLSFGLFSPKNGTVVTVLFICAASIAAALFLIMEMNRPLDGILKVSVTPLRDALVHLGR